MEKAFYTLSKPDNKLRIFSLLTVLIAVFSLASSCLLYSESLGNASNRTNLSKNSDISFKNNISKHVVCLTERCVKYCISDSSALLKSVASVNSTDTKIPDYPPSYRYSDGYIAVLYRPINTYLNLPSNLLIFKRNPILRV